MNQKVADKLRNSLFIDDNLNILLRIPDQTIDLIATDPPFNTARFQATKTNSYPDVWRNGQVFTDVLEAKLRQALIPQKSKEQLFLLLDLAQGLRINGQPAAPTADRTFLAFMALRVLEMKRVLKETGSLYWHCDPTMSHYIKILLDIVFGKTNFRNQIVWCYAGGGIPQDDFPRKHDIIFRYSKAANCKFFPDSIRVKYDSNYKATVFKRQDSRAPGKTYGPNPAGKIPEDWWSDITRAYGEERTGYPTQKPLALYERIIKSSSSQGDIVLDPFCGCATTPIAALKTGRNFIGVDVNGVAMRLINQRIDRQIRQGNLFESQKEIKIIVNPQLIRDSIDDLNGLIGGNRNLAPGNQDSLDKYIADRQYLQNVFDNQADYYQPQDYLPVIDKPSLSFERALSSTEKKTWKEKAIQTAVNQLTGYFDCPGFWAKGRHQACRNNNGQIIPNSTNLEIDRIIPASFGGDYTLSNIRLLCNQCNRRRGDLI